MDQIRVSKKNQEVALEGDYEPADDYEDQDLMQMQGSQLNKSLEKIPSDEKALILMKYQDDFSIKEIADTLKITESAVKMRLLRSKEKLRKLYLENMVVFALIVLKLIFFWKK
jgi:RNA polymerase sigma-70 factor (ECF subfamily)